jgi:nucleoside-diphosphate-sugar epimerase
VHIADLAATELEPLVEGVDGIFHLAARAGVRGSWGEAFDAYVRENVLVTQRVFEAAARAGVRVVFASSSSVYGDAERLPTPESVRPQPISPYGVTKLACEQLADAYLRSAGLDAVVLRYFTVYGPRQRPDMAFARIIAALRDGTPFEVFGSGSQSRDFTFVADAVSATEAAMAHGLTGAVYNVGGGTEASLADVIAMLEALSARRLDIRHASEARGDVRRTAADTAAIRRDLGWAPTTTLQEGLAAQLASALGDPQDVSPQLATT